MRRIRTKAYLGKLRSRVIEAERRVKTAKEELDQIRSFWRREWMEYDKETAVLKKLRSRK